jgi:ubiquinone/menaquinone biosynthesis C-methylase UbiE
MADHICPWWMGYLLANPIRRLLEKPEKLLEPFVKKGMTVVDYGCGMGFFTLALARMVGPEGKVFAVDVQQRMLSGMQRRAERAGLSDRIVPVLVESGSDSIDESVDFVAALYVVHELPDRGAFFSHMLDIMKSGARLLVLEPRFHVTKEEFMECVDNAGAVGFKLTEESVAGRAWSAALESP